MRIARWLIGILRRSERLSPELGKRPYDAAHRDEVASYEQWLLLGLAAAFDEYEYAPHDGVSLEAAVTPRPWVFTMCSHAETRVP